MKNIKKYLKTIFGCLLIAVALNTFYAKNDILPAGIFGVASLLDNAIFDRWIIILAINFLFLLLGAVTLPTKKVERSVIPFLLIPVLCYFTRNLSSYVDLEEVDLLLTTLYGSVIIGLGYRFIYRESYYVSASDTIAQLEKRITKTNIINYLIDAILIIVSIQLFGIENSMYTLISIVIIEVLSKRAELGTSDSKVFYIITKNFKEVRDYIIDELNYTLTAFDVKGGFLKKKNTIIMTVIPTKDYYKLREGVKLIDPTAFISITDSYEVINQNKEIEKPIHSKED